MAKQALPALQERMGDVTQFRPEQTNTKLRRAGVIADEAAEMRDWELLRQAVAFQVDEQIRFVKWWTEVVSGGLNSAGGDMKSLSRDLGTTISPMKQTQDDTHISNQRVARWRKATGMTVDSPVPVESKCAEYRQSIENEARKAANWVDNHLAFSAGNDEWCTPVELVDRARTVMGGHIDLDPCTNKAAQSRIQAERFFTKEDNALNQRWDADTAWLNPPYSKGVIGLVVQKLLDEHAAGHVKQVVVLVNASTSSEWFQRLLDIADCVCFAKDRIKFQNQDGTPAEGSPPIGQVFFYFGPEQDRFVEHFRPIGVIR